MLLLYQKSFFSTALKNGITKVSILCKSLENYMKNSISPLTNIFDRLHKILDFSKTFFCLVQKELKNFSEISTKKFHLF